MTNGAPNNATKSQALQLLRLATRISDGTDTNPALISLPKSQFYKILPLGNFWEESNGSSMPPKCGVTWVSAVDVVIALNKNDSANPQKIAGMSLKDVQNMRNWEFNEEVRRAKQEEPNLQGRA